ncbi:MAG: nucleotidyltransferase domain-containing protein [Proteobacteria bacterium]|nr:nucleotidyltransferase domain-containing protein [Pseudomonadota bacterium]
MKGLRQKWIRSMVLLIPMISERLYNLVEVERQGFRDRITEILNKRHEILFAYLYGSFIEEPDLPFHDIDIGVYVSGLPEAKSVPYMLDLAQMISETLGMPVDARVLNFTPVSYLYHVIQGDLLVDRDDDFRSTFVERVIAKYLDIKPRIYSAMKEVFAT